MFSDNTNITFLFFFTICARSLFILFNVVIFLDLNKHIPPLMRIIILNSICPLTDTRIPMHTTALFTTYSLFTLAVLANYVNIFQQNIFLINWI